VEQGAVPRLERKIDYFLGADFIGSTLGGFAQPGV
jgi:hypothetical protein